KRRLRAAPHCRVAPVSLHALHRRRMRCREGGGKIVQSISGETPHVATGGLENRPTVRAGPSATCLQDIHPPQLDLSASHLPTSEAPREPDGDSHGSSPHHIAHGRRSGMDAPQFRTGQNRRQIVSHVLALSALLGVAAVVCYGRPEKPDVLHIGLSSPL